MLTIERLCYNKFKELKMNIKIINVLSIIVIIFSLFSIIFNLVYIGYLSYKWWFTFFHSIYIFFFLYMGLISYFTLKKKINYSFFFKITLAVFTIYVLGALLDLIIWYTTNYYNTYRGSIVLFIIVFFLFWGFYFMLGKETST
jgi:hypothetical protein